MSDSSQVIEFNQSGDFRACDAAVQWCRDHGISVGSMQRGSPRGLLYGDYSIAKWRNLDSEEQADLDGVMTGDMRNGPVKVTLYNKKAGAK